MPQMPRREPNFSGNFLCGERAWVVTAEILCGAQDMGIHAWKPDALSVVSRYQERESPDQLAERDRRFLTVRRRSWRKHRGRLQIPGDHDEERRRWHALLEGLDDEAIVAIAKWQAYDCDGRRLLTGPIERAGWIRRCHDDASPECRDENGLKVRIALDHEDA